MAKKNLRKKDIDFLSAYNRKTVEIKESQSKLMPIIIVLLTLSIGGLFGYLKFDEYRLNKELDDINDKLTGLEAKYDVPNYNLESTLLSSLRATTKLLNGAYDNLNTYSEFDTELLDTILVKPPYTKVISFKFDRTSGTVSIGLQANKVEETEAYVRDLRESGKYLDVYYTGYDSSALSQAYVYNVTIILKGGN